VEQIRDFGVEVNLFEGSGDYQKDYSNLLRAIPSFDYYLYLGLDEGSMGTLDALSAGVPLIITPEGFHMDLNVNIDHPFITYDELHAILHRIVKNKNNRISSAANLTWKEYANKHIITWEKLCYSKNIIYRTALRKNQIKEHFPKFKKYIYNFDDIKNNILVYFKIKIILWRKYLKSDFKKTLGKIIHYPLIIKQFIRNISYFRKLLKSIYKGSCLV
jgi:hypothetical protein